jgi:hypothetical protein
MRNPLFNRIIDYGYAGAIWPSHFLCHQRKKANKKAQNLNRHQTESFDGGFFYLSVRFSQILNEMMDWWMFYTAKLIGCEDLAKVHNPTKIHV